MTFQRIQMLYKVDILAIIEVEIGVSKPFVWHYVMLMG